MREAKQSNRTLLWLIPLAVASFFIIKNNKEAEYRTNQGLIFGTVYNMTYQYTEDLQPEIDTLLQQFNRSLSPFLESSVISKVNRNEEVVTDSFFTYVFKRSLEISRLTDGAFDITIAPLVNAWGFGFKKSEWIDSTLVDSLLQFTGYEKIRMDNNQVIKTDPHIMITCSAIAKGYATDVIANFLSGRGIKNFMVEIGGEVVVKGENPTGEAWKIGINAPIEDAASMESELQSVLQLTDCGLATSGNYRNFYYKDGIKYAHTIDPRTGYPVQQDILSATVIAADCLTADALATAFMVMGLEQVKVFLATHPEIDAYLIYTDDEGNTQDFYTDNLTDKISIF
ncbi:MAG: FAD:protein FMN transferase [Bacteroides sp.]|nr:FAD:protein FMN transferase [Bacteroides sp.]